MVYLDGGNFDRGLETFWGALTGCGTVALVAVTVWLYFKSRRDKKMEEAKLKAIEVVAAEKRRADEAQKTRDDKIISSQKTFEEKAEKDRLAILKAQRDLELETEKRHEQNIHSAERHMEMIAAMGRTIERLALRLKYMRLHKHNDAGKDKKGPLLAENVDFDDPDEGYFHRLANGRRD
jgi:hypothetical protein